MSNKLDDELLKTCSKFALDFAKSQEEALYKIYNCFFCGKERPEDVWLAADLGWGTVHGPLQTELKEPFTNEFGITSTIGWVCPNCQ
jgi:hypothetical protein